MASRHRRGCNRPRPTVIPQHHWCTAGGETPLPFRLNGRGASFAGSLLPLPCGVTRHPKTVINRFEMAPPTVTTQPSPILHFAFCILHSVPSVPRPVNGRIARRSGVLLLHLVLRFSTSCVLIFGAFFCKFLRFSVLYYSARAHARKKRKKLLKIQQLIVQNAHGGGIDLCILCECIQKLKKPLLTYCNCLLFML